MQALTFLGQGGDEDVVAHITSQKGKGEVRTFELEPTDRIIGVYGYADSKGDVRGFGFLAVSTS